MHDITVTIDVSHPGAKSLLEHLNSLEYVKVNTNADVEGDDDVCGEYFLCRSMKEMDAILDQALVDIEKGRGTDHDKLFEELGIELFGKKL